MELRKLKHVCVLARAGTYVKAAQELHITQSALSRSVQSLEDEFRIRIFDRGRAGVRLTTAGRQLIARAEKILFAARGLQHELELVSKGESGLVAFGLGPVVASTFLLRVLTESARARHSLQLRVEINNPHALLQSLDSELIEFCICSVEHFALEEKYLATNLVTLPFSLYVRAGHPLAAVASPLSHDILKYPLLCGNTPAATLANLKSMAGLKPDETSPSILTCDDFVALKHAALDSDAVLMASLVSVVAELEAGSMVELSRNPFTGVSAIQPKIITLAGRTLSPGAQHVIGNIVAHCSELTEMLKARQRRSLPLRRKRPKRRS